MAELSLGSALFLLSPRPHQCPLFLYGGSANEVLLRGPAEGYSGGRYEAMPA